MTTFKAKIGAADIKHYDGVNRTFDRTTSSGGTITQAKLGNVVDVLQAYGDGVTPSESALLDAIRAIGSNARTLELAPGTWPITANLTTLSTLTLRLRRGAVLDVDTGITLDLSASCVMPEVTTGWYSGSGTTTVNTARVFVPQTPGTMYVSSNDTTLGYLNGKLTAGTGVTLTEGTDGGNETLAVAAPTAGRVSSDDTTPGYLDGKLVAGAGVTLTVGNAGANETLSIAAPTAGKVSSNDTTAGYLNGKLVAGDGVTLTEGTDGGNETLTVAASIPGSFLSAANATAHTIGNSEAEIESLDLGTTVVNAVYLVSGQVTATNGGTGGYVLVQVKKKSGDGVIKFATEGAANQTIAEQRFYAAASMPWTANVFGIATISTGGSLILQLNAKSNGSDSTASTSTLITSLTAIRIK